MSNIFKTYRTGATGALLDEYEKAVNELNAVIEGLSPDDLVRVIDPDTADENCRSFQAILSHVVYAGFGYAASIKGTYTANTVRRPYGLYESVGTYISVLADMVVYTEEVLSAVKDSELEQLDNSLKIRSGWGQVYDIEQMMEHAIVHILRHRRQIERLLQSITL